MLVYFLVGRAVCGLLAHRGIQTRCTPGAITTEIIPDVALLVREQRNAPVRKARYIHGTSHLPVLHVIATENTENESNSLLLLATMSTVLIFTQNHTLSLTGC